MAKNFKDGPAYIAASAADLYTPPTGQYALVRHIHVANKDVSTRTFTIYLGATGASAGGTEITGLDHSIDAGKEADFYFPAGLMLTTSDFLVGVASSASKLTCTITGELYAA